MKTSMAVTIPTLIIMISPLQVLIRAINLDIGNNFCSNAEETSCPASGEDRGNTNESHKNPLESSIFGDAKVEDDDQQRNRLNEVFWGDASRAATHERLEWWLAQIRNLNFPHLEEHLYRYTIFKHKEHQTFLSFVFCRAGVEAGVYLSQQQRPISAQPGLRAK